MASYKDLSMRNNGKDNPRGSKALKFSTLNDGTRVVTSLRIDIKRPLCGGIDVHKSVLMAAACITDKDTLSAVVRRFFIPSDHKFTAFYNLNISNIHSPNVLFFTARFFLLA